MSTSPVVISFSFEDKRLLSDLSAKSETTTKIKNKKKIILIKKRIMAVRYIAMTNK
ncbi:hypothetical protein PU02_1223 [Bartonella ancashensis]|uniref:Uncharacterized protein n=1 Tax=Bartonella ancashensis TaxID=1318743 RepID=A0A0M4M4E9_9HYPH|nr:hypothetical protein PU02_1223 [Bartonella ancashensis]